MTDLLYYDDAYLREFTATITAVDTRDDAVRIALDRTAFYPGGGGQPHDAGWLVLGDQRLHIERVKKQGAQIWHTLADAALGSQDLTAGSPLLAGGLLSGTDGGEPLIREGARVQCELDWARRYKLMRTHTAMHILCGVVWRGYGASVTGGNMEPGQSRMDFEFESLSRDLIGEIEEKCNAEVAAAREVRTQILPREEAFQIPDLIRTKINLLPENIQEVRTVEIVGLDLQADGDTHVHNTREVGGMQVVDYKSKSKINKRIYIELAE